jgi:trimeric autotransporter adhesin
MRKFIKTYLVSIGLAMTCIALPHGMQAVLPPPDGGYPGLNTAEGENALFSLTTGTANTAVGWFSLKSNTAGSFNTAVGVGTLLFNVGDQSMNQGVQNTAIGAAALLLNTSGSFNTAVGVTSLSNNTVASRNTAVGYNALSSNVDGHENTAIGVDALSENSTGTANTANGFQALQSNATGDTNVAIGYQALDNNTTGGANVAIGYAAGDNLTTGDGNVCIGESVYGVAGESNTTRIRNIYSSVASGRQVYVDSDDKIGTLSSSRRYKEEIKQMDKASEAVLSLKPVTFRYKKEVDPTRCLSFGLIAEEVAEVNPYLVTCNAKGAPETVRYEAVNAMLLNEFLKEHKRVQELEATVVQQQQQIDALVAHIKEQESKIQKVGDQLEMGHATSQVATR